MADIAHGIEPDTDYLLDGLEAEWDAGVSTAREWSCLSDEEQATFIEAWAIPRGYLRELCRRSQHGELTADQQSRLRALQERIDRQRAIVEAALESAAI